ncbi:MAG: flagellar hook protein FlgE [Burkholderiaceae bacterium]|jgi:flagellar hook protein FlgE|nr:flagellar hook protein FlgE [Burkholderiaceae bacterium]
MGFQQGLSGLRTSSKSLDVISNNIANASTVGFKQAQAQFADIYAYATGAKNQVGIGAMVMRVQQQFTQGNLSTSANALDVAINGNGFFRFSDNGSIKYSRNGQLELTKDGYLVNGAGYRLTGYSVYENGNIAAGAPTEIQISSEDITPNATTHVTTILNLDSRSEVIDSVTHPFDPTEPLSYNNSTAIDVYDSLGNMHVLQTFYVKTGPLPGAAPGTHGTWDVYVYTDGEIINDAVPPRTGSTTSKDGTWAIGSLTFDEYGKPIGTQQFMNMAIPGINGAAITYPVILDYTGTTQYGSNFGVNDNQQDGFTSGRLISFSMDSQGYILGSYTNGKTQMLGQVVLTNFRNPNGLTALGDNMYSETLESGAPITGAPQTGPLGTLQSYYVENSNVDLTEQLVEMITAQRVYQANAQTIKTEDSIMNTLVNLR